MPDPVVQVMLCVNDERGHPTGRVSGIDVRDDDGHELELAGDWLDDDANPTCDIDPAARRVRVGRRRFTILGHREHVGNWSWDCVTMARGDARALIAHAVARGFVVEMATLDNDLLPPAVR